MRVIYENERGKIAMHGGGNAGFNIINISGLSLPENNVNTIRYPNVAGQFITKSTPMERYITISGDVYDESGKKMTNAARVFSLPGVLYITTYGKTKKINCRTVSFDTGNKKGSYIPFTLQLCADHPYFQDIYETKVNISNREGKLSSPFVLGCVFSERVTKRNVVNSGDVAIEPVFEISSEQGCLCPEGITIKNTENGASITLLTDVSAGEAITVDVKNREITSNLRGNILFCIKKDTSLSRFSLNSGVSLVEISAPGLSDELTVVCRYNNSYATVVV